MKKEDKPCIYTLEHMVLRATYLPEVTFLFCPLSFPNIYALTCFNTILILKYEDDVVRFSRRRQAMPFTFLYPSPRLI